MSYVLQNIPDKIEQMLRERAAAEHKSLDAAAIDALERGLGLKPQQPVKRRDLSDIAGSWVEDPETEAVLAEQNETDSQPTKRRDLSDIAGQRLIDDEMREIFEEQRRIDPELWK